jgi:AcrR family transcriptional regulator
MAVSRQGDLRANQKERTRAALAEAASELLREGSPPTVAEAAERAKVSRATAYRYFPTQEALLVEIADVRPTVDPVEAMLAELSTDDVEARLRCLIDTFNPLILAEEPQMRAALRVYLDTWLESRRRGEDMPVREGRRVRWLDEVLAPLRERLPEAEYRRLRSALALTMSIEAIVVMKDACRLDDDEEILATLRWAAGVLLGAATADGV